MAPFFLLKTILSALLIALISEVAKRSPAFAALIASLPLISVLGMIWLWHDTKDSEKIAAHAQATFWYVLPSLPMFLVLPWLLRQGMPFVWALTLCCLLTAMLYLLMVVILRRFGIVL